MKYNFLNLGGKNNIYRFETNSKIIYEIKFKPTPYLFGDDKNELSEYIFEFIIEVAFNPNLKLSPNDLLIGATIAKILKDFYILKDNTASIYICDSSDGKQLSRERKFNQWFDYFNDSNFIKFNESLFDNNQNLFPIAIIMKKDNPYALKIIGAFLDIVNHNNDNKNI